MEETSWREASWKRHLEQESWMRNHRGDIMEGGVMEEASGGGIMEEASWRRHHGGRHHGGGIMEETRRHLEEASWMRNHGGDIMEEASGGAGWLGWLGWPWGGQGAI